MIQCRHCVYLYMCVYVYIYIYICISWLVSTRILYRAQSRLRLEQCQGSSSSALSVLVTSNSFPVVKLLVISSSNKEDYDIQKP